MHKMLKSIHFIFFSVKGKNGIFHQIDDKCFNYKWPTKKSRVLCTTLYQVHEYCKDRHYYYSLSKTSITNTQTLFFIKCS